MLCGELTDSAGSVKKSRGKGGLSKNKLNHSSPTDQATSSSRASAASGIPLHLCQPEITNKVSLDSMYFQGQK